MTVDPPSTHEPPPFWRPRLHALQIALAIYIVIHLGIMLSPPSWWSSIGLSPAWRNAAWLPYPFVLLGVIRAINRGDRATRRRFSEGELPCWTCGYNLARTEPPDPCPECGQPFDPDALRQRWRTTFARRPSRRETPITR